jgi:hypothetical protein
MNKNNFTQVLILLVLVILILITLYIYYKRYTNYEYFIYNSNNYYKYLTIFGLNPFFLELFKKPKNKIPKNVEVFLSKYKDYKVTKIQVCRKPIEAAIQSIIEFMTSKKINQAMKIRGIDDIFHLWSNITLESPFENQKQVEVQIEKNAIVQIFNKPLIVDNCLTISIPPEKRVTFETLLKNAENVHPYPFWLYDATNNNCQEFINSLLVGSGYINPEISNFLYQNAEELFESLGFSGSILGKLLLFITNIGAHFTNFYYKFF